MTKLPENPELLKLYRNGLSDKEIAERFDVTVQAVNKRLDAMGIKRQPFSTQVRIILEAAWPAKETQRSKFIGRNRARDLYAFLRRQLGDKGLTPNQLAQAERFERVLREENAVLDFQPDQPEEPWVFVPRTPQDGSRVIRWPEGRELPTGKALKALELPKQLA
jgi:hypothetical protein